MESLTGKGLCHRHIEAKYGTLKKEFCVPKYAINFLSDLRKPELYYVQVA